MRMNRPDEPAEDYLLLEDAALLGQCEVDTYRASGPGGQHRNKVSSGVRLRHRPTGVMAKGEESRSQHDNKRMALRRLRMHLACQVRRDATCEAPPPVLAECLFRGKGARAGNLLRLKLGRRDRRFWPVAAAVLDVLEARQGRLSEAAAVLGISTGNLSSFLTGERHLLAAAQRIRQRHGLKLLRQG
jgi:hypothetical protein